MPQAPSPARARRRRPLLGEPVHADFVSEPLRAYERVYRVVRRIPRGRVMTYGWIASMLAQRLSARAVGWALHGCPRGVPWHRVVNASGGCSTERLPDLPPGLQRALLESEGVDFRSNGTLDLETYGWLPRQRGSIRRSGSARTGACRP
jgi:methylated-DNA-protein-cysteine methyltransferase related protein